MDVNEGQWRSMEANGGQWMSMEDNGCTIVIMYNLYMPHDGGGIQRNMGFFQKLEYLRTKLPQCTWCTVEMLLKKAFDIYINTLLRDSI